MNISEIDNFTSPLKEWLWQKTHQTHQSREVQSFSLFHLHETEAWDWSRLSAAYPTSTRHFKAYFFGGSLVCCIWMTGGLFVVVGCNSHLSFNIIAVQCNSFSRTLYRRLSNEAGRPSVRPSISRSVGSHLQKILLFIFAEILWGIRYS